MGKHLTKDDKDIIYKKYNLLLARYKRLNVPIPSLYKLALAIKTNVRMLIIVLNEHNVKYNKTTKGTHKRESCIDILL